MFEKVFEEPEIVLFVNVNVFVSVARDVPVPGTDSKEPPLRFPMLSMY
jgi:hypothetical protein